MAAAREEGKYILKFEQPNGDKSVTVGRFHSTVIGQTAQETDSSKRVKLAPNPQSPFYSGANGWHLCVYMESAASDILDGADALQYSWSIPCTGADGSVFTLTSADLLYTTTYKDTAVTAGIPVKIGDYTIPNGVALKLGAMNGPITPADLFINTYDDTA